MPNHMFMLMLAFIFTHQPKWDRSELISDPESATKVMRKAERSRARRVRVSTCVSLMTSPPMLLLSSMNLVDFENSSTCSREKRRKNNDSMFVYVCYFYILSFRDLSSGELPCMAHYPPPRSSVMERERDEERREKEKGGRRKTVVVVQRILFAWLKVRQVFLGN